MQERHFVVALNDQFQVCFDIRFFRTLDVEACCSPQAIFYPYFQKESLLTS
jgi:hypothetical protein